MPQRKRLLLRLDPGVYEAVARWAADDLRSVNAQIEYAVRRALQAAGRSIPARQTRDRADEPAISDADDAKPTGDADGGGSPGSAHGSPGR